MAREESRRTDSDPTTGRLLIRIMNPKIDAIAHQVSVLVTVRLPRCLLYRKRQLQASVHLMARSMWAFVNTVSCYPRRILNRKFSFRNYNRLFYTVFAADSPVLLSFPHFYMGDQRLRDAVQGMDPPDADRHEFYIDVQPVSISAIIAADQPITIIFVYRKWEWPCVLGPECKSI